jgi:hypothetical protein
MVEAFQKKLSDSRSNGVGPHSYCWQQAMFFRLHIR